MISAIISGVIAAGTQIYGGIKKSQAARAAKRKEEAELSRERSENQNWYNRNRFEDPTQNAYYQAAINGTRQTFLDSLKSIAGSNAVMGGSNASVAAAKEKASNAMAQMNANIAAKGAARQQQVEDAYLRNDRQIGQQQRSMDRFYGQQQEAAISDALVGLGNVTSSAIQTFAQNGSATRAANDVATDSAATGTNMAAANQKTADQVAADTSKFNSTEYLNNAYEGTGYVAPKAEETTIEEPSVVTPLPNTNDPYHNRWGALWR